LFLIQKSLCVLENLFLFLMFYKLHDPSASACWHWPGGPGGLRMAQLTAFRKSTSQLPFRITGWPRPRHPSPSKSTRGECGEVVKDAAKSSGHILGEAMQNCIDAGKGRGSILPAVHEKGLRMMTMVNLSSFSYVLLYTR
jgi:hypothetical protein